MHIRLHIDQPIGPGQSLTLGKAHTQYLGQVMRLKAGAVIALFNGTHGEWSATINTITKKETWLTVGQQTREQATEPDIWLCFAPIKHGRIDFLAQKATELGASELHPIMTERTIVTRVNTERLQANAIEAAEQSERLTIPAIHAPTKFEKCLADWPADRTLIYCDETGKGEPPATLLPSLKLEKRALLIGPEGGFAPKELEQLRAHKNAKAMTLGPRVLRADTAALATLTCLAAFSDDWNEKPHFE